MVTAIPRPLRPNADGLVYHAINRGNKRRQVFFDDGDYPSPQEPRKIDLTPFLRDLDLTIRPRGRPRKSPEKQI